jgi:hypothetical protein
MSTGLNPPTAGKLNLQTMAPPEESSAEPISQSPPDSCQLQADAVGEAGEQVNRAMNLLRDRLRALRWCREAQAAAAGRSVNGFDRVADSIEGLGSLVETAVSRSGQLVDEMNSLAGVRL